MATFNRPSPTATQLVRCSVLASGVFLGAMVLIALAVVSFWKSLEPTVFQAWFGSHSFRLGRVMIPLGATAFVTIVVSLVLCSGGGAAREVKRDLWIATASLVGVVVTYLGFVHPINLQFASETTVAGDIPALLSRWEFWHWVRVVLGTLAFAALIRACEFQARAGTHLAAPRVTAAALAA